MNRTTVVAALTMLTAIGCLVDTTEESDESVDVSEDSITTYSDSTYGDTSSSTDSSTWSSTDSTTSTSPAVGCSCPCEGNGELYDLCIAATTKKKCGDSSTYNCQCPKDGGGYETRSCTWN